jgi:polysaccharide export outer membrane protein
VKAANTRFADHAGRRRRTTGAVALGLLVAFGLGCGTRQLSPAPMLPDRMERETYTIGVTDVLRITVWRNEDLNTLVPVRPDGKISVPLLDDMQADGLAPTELKEILTREYSEFITAPNVTVVVVELNSRFVSVIGAVNREGRYPLSRNLRVLEVIAYAGGFNTFADKDDVRIVRRQEDGSETEYRFDYDKYIKGRAPGTNIELLAGDTVIVPE